MAAEPRGEKKFLRAKEAAHLSDSSVWMIWRWARNAKKNGMPVRKIGRTILIPREKFLLWLEGSS